jgi:hypothetical protein
VLGTFGPGRLIEKWLHRIATAAQLPEIQARARLRVVGVEREGLGEVVALSTTSGTYFADGFGAHNSVAEHAVLVASKLRRLGAPLSVCLAGLHHDDAEGLNGVGDPQRPAKPLLGAEFVERDRLIDRAVWRAVGWPDREQEALWTTGDLHGGLVKRVDEWACRFEASHIMHSGGLNWPATFDDSALPPIPTDPEDEIHTWFPPTAHDAYLSLHFEFATAAYDWTRVAA